VSFDHEMKNGSSDSVFIGRPFQKVLIKQLSSLAAGDRASYPHLVWLQGQVINVSKDRDTIQVVDSNTDGQVKEDEGVLVSGCSKVPGNTGDIGKGQYCQVLGELERRSPHVSVKAVKVVNLSKVSPNVEALRATWTDEVRELDKIRLTNR